MRYVKDILKVKGDQVWSIEANATIKEALELLSEKNVGALPVVDSGKLVGILSERDYTRRMAQLEKCTMDAPVSETMTSKLFIVDPSSSVEECMALMTEKRIRHLPVMDGDVLVGIVSIGDLLKDITTRQSEKIENLEKFFYGSPRN